MDKLTDAEFTALQNKALKLDECPMCHKRPEPAVWTLRSRCSHCGVTADMLFVHFQEQLARALAPQPCGHPGACVVSSDEGTSYCGWCDDVAPLKPGNVKSWMSYYRNTYTRFAQALDEKTQERDLRKVGEKLAQELEKTEWIAMYDSLDTHFNGCPSCLADYMDGHKEDCSRQAALAAWREANEPVSDTD